MTKLIYETFPEKVNANIDQRQKYILSYNERTGFAYAEFVSAYHDVDDDFVVLLIDRSRLLETTWSDELVRELIETGAEEDGVLLAKTKTVKLYE